MDRPCSRQVRCVCECKASVARERCPVSSVAGRVANIIGPDRSAHRSGRYDGRRGGTCHHRPVTHRQGADRRAFGDGADLNGRRRGRLSLRGSNGRERGRRGRKVRRALHCRDSRQLNGQRTVRFLRRATARRFPRAECSRAKYVKGRSNVRTGKLAQVLFRQFRDRAPSNDPRRLNRRARERKRPRPLPVRVADRDLPRVIPVRVPVRPPWGRATRRRKGNSFRNIAGSFQDLRYYRSLFLCLPLRARGWSGGAAVGGIGPGGFLKRRFLGSLGVTRSVTSAISTYPTLPVLRIKPNVNIVARFLIQGSHPIGIIRVSFRSITCLHSRFPTLRRGVVRSSFLGVRLRQAFSNQPFILANGCPCGVSDRVFFGVLSCGSLVPYYANVVRGRITRHVTTNPNDGACNVLDMLVRT